MKTRNDPHSPRPIDVELGKRLSKANRVTDLTKTLEGVQYTGGGRELIERLRKEIENKARS